MSNVYPLQFSFVIFATVVLCCHSFGEAENILGQLICALSSAKSEYFVKLKNIFAFGET